MLYYKCPSCKTTLADKQILFEEGMKNIENNEKLSGKDKDKAKRKLLDDLGVINICCRIRILTYTKEEEILV